jgi:hypothetical protein
MRATLLDTRLLLLLLLLLKALSTRAAACPVLLPEPASTAETANAAFCGSYGIFNPPPVWLAGDW